MDIQTATVLITGISVIIAAINSIISSRRAEKQRQIDLFMNLYNSWNSMDFMKAFRTLWRHDWNISYDEYVRQHMDDES
jgi:hypothetical protein